MILLLIACGRDPSPPPDAASAIGTPVVAPALQSDAPETVLREGGLTLERQRWRLVVGDEVRTSGLAFRAKVSLAGTVDVVPSTEVRDFSAFLPTDAGPWAVINGGFYEDGPMGLVVSDGVERSPLSPRGGSGVLSFGPAGAAIVHRDAWEMGPAEALQSIDRVVDAGSSLVARLDGPGAARSAFVVGRDGLWLVALVDDRSLATPEADGRTVLSGTVGRGLSLGWFARYLIETTDAIAALNLDGAVSTSMAARGGARDFVLQGERGTINAVVLRPRPGG